MIYWRTKPKLDIDKNYLYDLYFNKNMTKLEICKILNCTPKVLDKRFKMWGWEFRNSGKMVAGYMKNKSTILPHLETIKKLYLDGNKTCEEISIIYGVSETSIARLLKNNNIKMRQLSAAQVKKIKIDNDMIYKLYVIEHKSCNDISSILNISAEAIRKILISYDITRRENSEQLKQLIGARKTFKCGLEEEIILLKEKISKSNRIHFEVDIDAKIIDKSIIRISKIDKENKVLMRCLLDGFEWRTSVSAIIKGCGCPQCKFKNQKETFLVLNNLLIGTKITSPFKLMTYIHDGLERKILVDFYIEYKNKKIVIEYNGDQHYKPIRFNGISIEKAEKNFIMQQIRDNALRKYCEINDIILIEIDGREYNIYNDNIKQYLEQIIKGI